MASSYSLNPVNNCHDPGSHFIQTITRLERIARQRFTCYTPYADIVLTVRRDKNMVDNVIKARTLPLHKIGASVSAPSVHHVQFEHSHARKNLTSREKWSVFAKFLFMQQKYMMRSLTTPYDYLVLYLGLIWFGLLCLGWMLIAIVLYPLLPKRWGRTLGRWVVMLGFRMYLASLSASRRCHFDLAALDALRGEPPLIIAPNHPCLLDAVMIISRLPNVACVIKADLMNNIFLGVGARMARYIPSEPLRKMIHLAVADFKHGSHLLLFPEGTRTTQDPVNLLKGSTALIAQRAQVPVQTVLIETDTHYLRKGWPLFRKPAMPITYRIRLGRRFDAPQNTQQFMIELQDYFANELVQGSAFHPTGTITLNTASSN
jgi:1-acyl-sn-glycerol-3-phosphate acyltransferase